MTTDKFSFINEFCIENGINYNTGDWGVEDVDKFKQNLVKLLEKLMLEADLKTHYGCGKNNEEVLVGNDPKDLCCHCYPHDGCVAEKGYRAYYKALESMLSKGDSGEQG